MTSETAQETHAAGAPRPAEIVKLGGSLTAAPELRDLLRALAGAGAPLVVVPGGGALADGVRALQPRLGFSELAAHRMAILAMEQTALAIADIEPGLAPCADIAAIALAHTEGRAALWLPARLAPEADVPASWDVTSDSLALWLAIRLGACALTLVKAAAVEHPDGPPERWAAEGLADAYLPVLAKRYEGRLRALSLGEALAHWRSREAA